MTITTRPVTPTDYPALAAFYATNFPAEATMTAVQLQAQDLDLVQARIAGRLLAFDAAQNIVASLIYSEAKARTDPPGAFWLYPRWPVGWGNEQHYALLYSGVQQSLAPYQPRKFQGMAREDQRELVAFFQHHHFQPVMQTFGANLDVTTFDPTPYATCEDRLHAAGIAIKTYAELAADLARDRKLYALVDQVNQEMPNLGQFDDQSFEQFVNDDLHSPAMLPDAYFVAVHGADYVGVSEVFSSDDPTVFDTRTTGVLPAYRRLGIALALKVRAIRYAQTHGATCVTTGMDATNTPIVALNQRLGFVPEPLWITFSQTVATHQEPL
jgi:GNAT superfamily N-acetyltransferase